MDQAREAHKVSCLENLIALLLTLRESLGLLFKLLTILSSCGCGLMVHVLFCRTLIWYWLRDGIIKIVISRKNVPWRNVWRRIPWMSDSAFGRLAENQIWFHWNFILNGIFSEEDTTFVYSFDVRLQFSQAWLRSRLRWFDKWPFFEAVGTENEIIFV